MQQSISRAGGASVAVIVMGVSGSGKSTLGGRLAEALDCAFLEGDAFHDPGAVAKMRAGVPLTDEDRWPWLDRLGSAIGAALGEGGAVVAGCSALRRAYRERLREAIGGPVRFVLLDGDREALLQRLSSRTGHFMPASLLDSQLATLERPGADETAVTLDASAPLGQLCEVALAWLAAPASGHQPLPALG